MKSFSLSCELLLVCLISLNMSACLSLPTKPMCFESYQQVSLALLTSGEVFLCCTDTAECQTKLSEAMAVSSEEEQVEYTTLAMKYSCNEQLVCALPEMGSNEQEGGEENNPTVCQTDSDCAENEQCEFNVCVTDVEDDDDFDGVPNAIDNCVRVSNAAQADCDQNGLGDACDPAGPCGGQLSGQTVNFVESRRALPEACVYLELEGTNLRTRSNSQGSFSTEFVFNLGSKRLLGFVGGGKNEDETECVHF